MPGLADECRLLMKCEFPSVARVYHVFAPTKPKECAAIVLENMASSLAQSIEARSLDETAMNMVIISMVKGLRFMLSNGILHRSISPSTVMLSSEGIAKLTLVPRARSGQAVEPQDVFDLATTIFAMLASGPRTGRLAPVTMRAAASRPASG